MSRINQFVGLVWGNRIPDIGCGMGGISDCLPDADCFGFDLSQCYISEVSNRYRARRYFKFALPGQEAVDGMVPFDIVRAVGFLHHYLNVDQISSLAL